MVCSVRSLTTVPTGKWRRLKRKPTKSFPASAKRTLLALVSTRSFKLTLALEVVAIVSTLFLDFSYDIKPIHTGFKVKGMT